MTYISYGNFPFLMIDNLIVLSHKIWLVYSKLSEILLIKLKIGSFHHHVDRGYIMMKNGEILMLISNNY